MRIHLISVGSTGDVQPLIALSLELKHRGHEVAILAFEELRGLVESAGISFSTLPGSANSFISAMLIPGANPLKYLRRFEECMRPVYPELLEAIYQFCQESDAVITTFFGSMTYAFAEKLNLPLFQTQFFPLDPTGEMSVAVIPLLRLGSLVNKMSYGLMYLMVGRLQQRYANPFFRQYGIRPRRLRLSPDYVLHGKKLPVLYAISPHVFSRPKDWDSNIHLTGFWKTPETDYHPSPALSDFLKSGDAPIYVGFGSMTSGDPAALVNALIAASNALNQRILFSCGWSSLGEYDIPENIFVLREYVPHAWLFQHVRAAVHHGGAGTTAAALRADIPALIVPFGGDQYFWGSRIFDLGCGPKPLPRSRLNPQSFTNALSELLHTPGFYENAKKIGRLLRAENGAACAADLIETELKTFQDSSSSTGQ